MDALDKSFATAPENYEGLRTKAWVLLGQHEFAQAREVALKLNKSAPDDVLVYGLLTDANIELGNYDEAEKAAQWMLDMRPGNVPGLTRGAYSARAFRRRRRAPSSSCRWPSIRPASRRSRTGPG